MSGELGKDYNKDKQKKSDVVKESMKSQVSCGHDKAGSFSAHTFAPKSTEYTKGNS